MNIRLAISIVFAFFCNFVFAGNYSYISGERISFSWNANDVLGIMRETGSQMRFFAKDIDPVDGHVSTFAQMGWALTANSTYYAYAPYSKDVTLNSYQANSIPVSYQGQCQRGNNNLESLADFDYMMGEVTPNGISADATINMHHVGAVLRFSCTVPENEVFTKFELTSEYDVLPTDLVMNLVSGSVSETSRSNSFGIALDNIEMQKDQTLIVYMMMPACDLSGIIIKPRFHTASGKTYVLKTYLGDEVKAGKLYNYYCHMTIDEDFVEESKVGEVSTRMFGAVNVEAPMAKATDFVLEKMISISTDITIPFAGNGSKPNRYDALGRYNVGRGVIIENGKKYIKQ